MVDLKLSDNAFSLTILILLSGKVTEMDEIDFDYEEPSLDPFEGEFSGSDDSENEDGPAVVNRDSLGNICHQHFAQGFCTQSMKRPSAPVKVGNRKSRIICSQCYDS